MMRWWERFAVRLRSRRRIVICRAYSPVSVRCWGVFDIVTVVFFHLSSFDFGFDG